MLSQNHSLLAMKFLLILLLLGVANSHKLTEKLNPELDKEWDIFKLYYGKTYHSAEEINRRLIWEQNLRVIREHNLGYDRGEYSFSLGINEFADMASEEFVKMFMTHSGKSQSSGSTFLPANNLKIPDTVDWREKGYVTNVKSQGSCGSCWAFTAIGAVEGQHFKSSGKLVSLSAQNLLDCDNTSQSCNGGFMDNAFRYIKNNHGIDTEDSYPYKAAFDTCHFNPANVGATVSGFVDLPKGDENALKQATASIGPISVAMDGSRSSFVLYKQGVYNEPLCSKTILSHSALIVGYGTENGQDYWLVKNSWGESWGEKGYIKMSRNKNNQCGIANMASYPLV